MPDPNAVGSLSSAQMDPNAAGLSPLSGSQNLPPRPLTMSQKIIRGALAGASVMAGPDANGQPRHGLANMLGGILSGGMTGLAAGADRSRGESGGGLAAMGRGFQARTNQLQQQRQQNLENQEAATKLQLEKASNARAQAQLINQQHEMGRLDQQFQLEKDKFADEKLNRLATLRVENNHIKDNLLKLHAVPVVGAPANVTDEELRDWAIKNMGTALANYDTLPIQDLETGKWTLYEVPKDQEMTVTYGGKKYTVPVDPAILVKAAQDETRDRTDAVMAEAEKLRAQAEMVRANKEGQTKADKTVSLDVAEQSLEAVGIPVPKSWEGKDEVSEKELQDLLKSKQQQTQANRGPATNATTTTQEPNVFQKIGNALSGKPNEKTTTRTATRPGEAPLRVAMTSPDGKAYWVSPGDVAASKAHGWKVNQ